MSSYSASGSLSTTINFENIGGISNQAGRPTAQAPGVTTIITYDPSTKTWGPHPSPSVPTTTNVLLNDLLNVEHVVPATNGHVLTYNSGASLWESAALPAFPIINEGKTALLLTGNADIFVGNNIGVIGTVPPAGNVSFYTTADANYFFPITGAGKMAISKTVLNGWISTPVSLFEVGDKIIIRTQYSILDPVYGFWRSTITSKTDLGTHWLFEMFTTSTIGNASSTGIRYIIDKDVPNTIDELSNVVITGTPADNEVLTYDTGTSKWINQAVPPPVATVRYMATYDQEGNGGLNVNTAVLGVWYQVPINLAEFEFVGLVGVTASNDMFQSLSTNALEQVKVTLDMGMYADVQDTICKYCIFVNNIYKPNSAVPNYSKNTNAFIESTSSSSWILPFASAQFFDIRVRFNEDNTPLANPTNINIMRLRLTINSV